jgi:hypothetical protein
MRDIFDDLPLSSENEMPRHNPARPGSEGHDEYLSMSEYEELRLMLTSAKAAFAQEDNDITPDPQIRKNVRAMVAARKKGFDLPAFNLKTILNYPLPAYQFGLAMVLVVFMAVLAGRNIGFNSQPGTVIVFKTDTVFEKSHKNAAPVMYLSDSQKRTISPASSLGNYLVDSIDISNDNGTDENVRPSGINPSSGSNLHSPVNKDINKPGDMDTPDKGGRSIEDTGKWNRYLHGVI